MRRLPILASVLAMTVPVTVRFFAAAREKTRCAEATVEVPPPVTVAALKAALSKRFPALDPLWPHLRVAVDQEFAGPDDAIPSGAEVALIPPVAGGAPLFQVVERPLALAEVVEAVSATGLGGVVTFSGAVRDATRGKPVVKLEYEAYAPMAQKKLAQIADEAAAKWPGTRLAVVHRVGTLVPGDLAVVIAAAAPHRKEAFRACEYVIDRLKEDVPIWKKEHFEDGQVWVGLGP